MTAKQLYEMVPESTTRHIDRLAGFYYNHVPESTYDNHCDVDIESDRIEIRYLKDHCYDGRRVWILATVWFDGKPVMVIQNAGREGDDHSARFITDKKLFLDMVEFINTLCSTDDEFIDVVDENEDMYKLTNFYNGALGDTFDQY